MLYLRENPLLRDSLKVEHTKPRLLGQWGSDAGKPSRPRWPMIVLRSPKGWTVPREVDGHYLEGFWRAHQIQITDIATNPAHLKLLET